MEVISLLTDDEDDCQIIENAKECLPAVEIIYNREDLYEVEGRRNAYKNIAEDNATACNINTTETNKYLRVSNCLGVRGQQTPEESNPLNVSLSVIPIQDTNPKVIEEAANANKPNLRDDTTMLLGQQQATKESCPLNVTLSLVPEKHISHTGNKTNIKRNRINQETIVSVRKYNQKDQAIIKQPNIEILLSQEKTLPNLTNSRSAVVKDVISFNGDVPSGLVTESLLMTSGRNRASSQLQTKDPECVQDSLQTNVENPPNIVTSALSHDRLQLFARRLAAALVNPSSDDTISNSMSTSPDVSSELSTGKTYNTRCLRTRIQRQKSTTKRYPERPSKVTTTTYTDNNTDTITETINEVISASLSNQMNQTKEEENTWRKSSKKGRRYKSKSCRYVTASIPIHSELAPTNVNNSKLLSHHVAVSAKHDTAQLQPDEIQPRRGEKIKKFKETSLQQKKYISESGRACGIISTTNVSLKLKPKNMPSVKTESKHSEQVENSVEQTTVLDRNRKRKHHKSKNSSSSKKRKNEMIFKFEKSNSTIQTHRNNMNNKLPTEVNKPHLPWDLSLPKSKLLEANGDVPMVSKTLQAIYKDQLKDTRTQNKNDNPLGYKNKTQKVKKEVQSNMLSPASTISDINCNLCVQKDGDIITRFQNIWIPLLTELPQCYSMVFDKQMLLNCTYMSDFLFVVLVELNSFKARFNNADKLKSNDLRIQEKDLAKRHYHAVLRSNGVYFKDFFEYLEFRITQQHDLMFVALFLRIFMTVRAIAPEYEGQMHEARKQIMEMLHINNYHNNIVSKIYESDSKEFDAKGCLVLLCLQQEFTRDLPTQAGLFTNCIPHAKDKQYKLLKHLNISGNKGGFQAPVYRIQNERCFSSSNPTAEKGKMRQTLTLTDLTKQFIEIWQKEKEDLPTKRIEDKLGVIINYLEKSQNSQLLISSDCGTAKNATYCCETTAKYNNVVPVQSSFCDRNIQALTENMQQNLGAVGFGTLQSTVNEIHEGVAESDNSLHNSTIVSNNFKLNQVQETHPLLLSQDQNCAKSNTATNHQRESAPYLTTKLRDQVNEHVTAHQYASGTSKQVVRTEENGASPIQNPLFCHLKLPTKKTDIVANPNCVSQISNVDQMPIDMTLSQQIKLVTKIGQVQITQIPHQSQELGSNNSLGEELRDSNNGHCELMNTTAVNEDSASSIHNVSEVKNKLIENNVPNTNSVYPQVSSKPRIWNCPNTQSSHNVNQQSASESNMKYGQDSRPPPEHRETLQRVQSDSLLQYSNDLNSLSRPQISYKRAAMQQEHLFSKLHIIPEASRLQNDRLQYPNQPHSVLCTQINTELHHGQSHENAELFHQDRIMTNPVLNVSSPIPLHNSSHQLSSKYRHQHRSQYFVNQDRILTSQWNSEHPTQNPLLVSHVDAKRLRLSSPHIIPSKQINQQYLQQYHGDVSYSGNFSMHLNVNLLQAGIKTTTNQPQRF